MSAPAVAVSRDGKKFAAAWMDKRLGIAKSRVYWAISDQPRFASDAPIHAISSGEQDHPSVAFAPDGTVWAAWEEIKGAHHHIWLRANTEKVQPQQLSSAADGKAYQPVVACNGGVVAVVYEASSNRKHEVICRVIVP